MHLHLSSRQAPALHLASHHAVIVTSPERLVKLMQSLNELATDKGAATAVPAALVAAAAAAALAAARASVACKRCNGAAGTSSSSSMVRGDPAALFGFGRIGCFNRDNSTRKGGTVQWRTCLDLVDVWG